MNYYEAREIKGKDGKGTGLYHFTKMNDRLIWPVGYCSPYEACPECKGKSVILPSEPKCGTCGNKGRIKKADPCPGHRTKEEAAEHYRQYTIDHRQEETLGSWSDCKVCGAPTKKAFIIGHADFYPLCDKHFDLETLKKLVEPIEQIISSY